jgi:hypothetical protein
VPLVDKLINVAWEILGLQKWLGAFSKLEWHIWECWVLSDDVKELKEFGEEITSDNALGPPHIDIAAFIIRVIPSSEVKDQPLNQREKLEVVAFLQSVLDLVLAVLDRPCGLASNLEVLGS